MPVGTTAALLIAGGAGLGGGLIAKSMSASKSLSAPMALPQPPSVDAATSTADKITKARRTASSQSIFTSPLGVSGEADIAKKTLLGQ